MAAWAKSGPIAYIQNEKAYLTWLRCKDGHDWQLVKPLEVPTFSTPVRVSLPASSSSYDVAVLDSLGTVQITELTSAHKLETIVSGLATADKRPRAAELDAIVGCTWLGAAKPVAVPVYAPPQETSPEEMQRNPPTQKSSWESVKAQGPTHPISGKNIFVCVNGNAMLRVLVELSDRKYKQFEKVLPGPECVLKVAFAAFGSDLMVSVYTSANQIMSFQVSLDLQAALAQQEKNVVHVVPLSSINVERPRGSRLCVFETVAPPRTTTTAPKGVQEIHTVFTLGEQSFVRVYLVAQRALLLHPSFQQLFPAKQENLASPQPPEWKITRIESFDAPKVVRDYFVSSTSYTILYSDGSIESKSLIPMDLCLHSAMLGFSEEQQEELAAAEHVCLSPVHSFALCLPSSSSVPTLHQIGLSKAPETISNAQAVQMATQLATIYAYTVYNNIQGDDFVAFAWNLIHKELPRKKVNVAAFYSTLCSETRRTLNISLCFDAPEDPMHVDRLVVMPSLLQRWMSLQLVLGTGPKHKHTSGGELAWAVLNLQLVAFALTWTLKWIANANKIKTAADQIPKIASSCYQIISMFGLVRWTTDFVTRICQELYLAMVSAPEKDKQPDDQKRDQDPAVARLVNHPNVFMSIILSKVVRFLLTYTMRGIRGLDQMARQLAAQEAALQRKDVAHMTLKQFQEIIASAPVSLTQFTRILSEVDKHLSLVYNNEKIPERTKQVLELELCKSVRTPNVLAPIVLQIVKVFKSQLSSIDIPSMFFYETTWLGVDGCKPTKGEAIDGIRKRIITSSAHLRQCSRCSLVSVCDGPVNSQVALWSSYFRRGCLCGGVWLPHEQP